MKHLLTILLVIFALTSCQEKKSENTASVKVKIEGLNEWDFQFGRGYGKNDPIKLSMKNGEMTFELPNVTEPEALIFRSAEEGAYYYFMFFVEAGENIYEGKLVPTEYNPKSKIVEEVQVIGSIANQLNKEWDRNREEIANKIFGDRKKLTPEKYDECKRAYDKKWDEWQLNWVKNHPKEWFSAFKANVFISHGTDIAMHELLLSYLDPKMNNKHVQELKAKTKEMKSTDVKLEDLIQAKNVQYKVDPSYKGADFKNVHYMSTIDGNKLCLLSKEGQFQIIDAKGKLLNTFQPNTKSPATSFAVSAANEIYALTPNYKTIVKNYRGREIKKQVVEGVECVVLDDKGTEKKRFVFEGLGSASGSKIMNGQLIVSDYATAKIYIYDSKTGEKKSEIADMRPCCGILDFCIGENNQLLVADLGAFRVQGYKLDGEKVLAFGKRGRGMEEFHGCCNPVNIGRLSNGAIITVEKTPTRIKIYSQDGARLIDGVEELVEGCSHIPMAVDIADNLYLASPKKGLVKCVAKL
jgi:hypothetical protein